jgi:hypothetical protein
MQSLAAPPASPSEPVVTIHETHALSLNAAVTLEPFRFLDLPPELRHLIYALYILEDADFAISYKLKQDEVPRDPNASPRRRVATPVMNTQVRKNMLPFEATSKRVRRELEGAQLHLAKTGSVPVPLNVLDANGLVRELPVDCFRECVVAYQVNWKWWHVDEHGLTDLVERLINARNIDIKVLCPLNGPLFEEWTAAREPLLQSVEAHSATRNGSSSNGKAPKNHVHAKLETLRLVMRRPRECYLLNRRKVVDAQTGLESWRKEVDEAGVSLEHELAEDAVADCTTGTRRVVKSRLYDEPLHDRRFVW